MMARIDHWKDVKIAMKKALLVDDELHAFLTPEIPAEADRIKFISRCLRKLKTRRMLLRAQWYTEIADGLAKVKKGRVALQIVFLMSLAEGVSKMRTSVTGMGSQKAVLD